MNVGGPGTVTVDGTVHQLGHGDCLYVGRGAGDVVLAPVPIGADDAAAAVAASSARFYLFSAPAHTAYPTTLVPAGQGTVRELGDQLTTQPPHAEPVHPRERRASPARSSWA